MLQERESSVSKQVSHLKILFKPEGNLSYSFIFLVVFDFFELGELFFLLGM